MTIAALRYHRPANTSEALRMLSDLGPGAAVLAGGQSLVPALRQRERRPTDVVDIAALRAELGSVAAEPRTVSVDAGVRQQELVDRVLPHHDALVEALRGVGDEVVRRRGTVVGIVANADPGCQLAAVAAAIGGAAAADSMRGRRWVPIADLFSGQRVLRPDELVTTVEFPATLPGEGSAFRQVSAREVGGPRLASVAARIAVEDGWCTDASVAVAIPGQGCTPLTEVTAALVGTGLTRADVDSATQRLAAELVPADDLFATSAYRSHVVRTLVYATVRTATVRAEGTL